MSDKKIFMIIANTDFGLAEFQLRPKASHAKYSTEISSTGFYFEEVTITRISRWLLWQPCLILDWSDFHIETTTNHEEVVLI